ncbi:MAG: PHP domain-containing protein [Candidatus Aminicenantes bacterium]|nr:PHP domain-containing protein [Candidatus Aminicenantes bacterium]
MSDGLVDLHIHSNRSCDGDHPPDELVGFAAAYGFRAVSIADHDTVAAYPEAVREGEALGVEVIPSMEVTTLFDDREFHVLLPFVDWEAPGVARIIERTAETRLEEARERVDLLRRAGVEVGWEEVVAATNGVPPLGVRIGQIILDKPQSRRNPLLAKYGEPENRNFGPYLFYRDFFTEGRPAYVLKRHLGLVEVLDLAPGTGAAPVLSHPGACFQRTTRKDLVALKDRGLVGVEVFTFYHTDAQVAEYKRLAEELDLVPTAGSDFHGRIKPHIAFGALRDGRYWMVERLRAKRGNGA